MGVVDAEVPDIDEEFQEGGRELESRLGREGFPVVEGKAPRSGTEGGVEDIAGFLPGVVDIDNALRRDVHVGDEGSEAMVDEKGIPVIDVFRDGLVEGLGVLIDGLVVAIIEERLEVLLGGGGV